MTAYGALISLKNTIHYILHSRHICLVGRSPEIIQLAYKELQPLQEILEGLDDTSKSRSRKKVNALDGRIKERVWEFEDLLESLLSHQILSQFPDQHIHRRKSHASQSRDVLLFSIDLQSLQDDVGSFIRTLDVMEKEYIHKLHHMPEDDDDGSISSRTKSKMIGLSDQIGHIKSHLMQRNRRKHVYALFGMAGVGKTALAMEIFQDPSHYECRAWIKVGRSSQLKQVLRGILAQICGFTLESDREIIEYLGYGMEGKKCLIVLDDVWETQLLNSLIDSLPDIKRGLIQILVTARERNVIENITARITSGVFDVVRFLNEEESKDLLCEKVFGEEICPPQLDKAATKIANSCEGLPLMIVAVAQHLSNRDPEYWNEVAEKRNSVFNDAYDEIAKVLFPSYDYLPQYLKSPFLYMGVFPQDYDTPPSKIINMLTAEGWFSTNKKLYFEESVWLCLIELCTHKSHVLCNGKSIFWCEMMANDRIMKTCRLHSSWRHLCRKEARKNKFYHVLNKLVDGLEEHVKGQRCLCLENNILFGIKEFCNSVRLNSTRSLLFFGPYHQYPIPIHVGFKLLRELDALKLRFYTFPTEILTLVQLKYLALTCNGQLPTTISKLFNLRVLIIHPHINIRCRAPSFVPIQIWDIQELDHIEILGRSLVAPKHVALLEKLTTLVGVNASICTISELSRRIPNIRKLGVEIELTPYDDHNDLLSCFAFISTLVSLKTLKCSITNPVFMSVPVAPCSLMLPRGLKKLHLSGTGFSWEYMDVIGALPLLQVLKLRFYAFRGSQWEAQEGSFPKLRFLSIEDSDLACLNLSSARFFFLSYLSMKHCYKLKEIHWPLYTSPRIKIELVNCNPLALSWANQLQPTSRTTLLHVSASSSFEEKPTTTQLERYGPR